MYLFKEGDQIKVKQIHGYPKLQGRTGVVLGIRYSLIENYVYNVRLEDNQKTVYLRDDQMEKL